MNFASFDLNLLRVLDALLRENSTVRAGERVGLSQPAVSAALGRLRAALGDELFLRRGQGLVPTDFARGLALPLREALDGIEAMLSGRESFDPAKAKDTFRISGTDFFAEMLMPDLGRRFAAAAPGMRVQLVDLVPENYIETLERYEVDLALIPQTAFPDWVESRPVFWSDFTMIARRGNDRLARHKVKPGDEVPADLFCDLRHVLMSPEGRLTAMGDAALARIGRERRIVMTMPFFSGVARVVGESDFVALLPRQLAERLADRFGLDQYRPPMRVEPALIVMCWHRRSSGNPAHRWMREQVAAILGPLNDGLPPLPSAGGG